MSDLVKVIERTHTQAMEQLQDGYVASVAASAGALAEFVTRDMHKYDVELIRQPDITVEQAAVRLQLKSTTMIRPKQGDTHIKFRFKNRPDFNSLACHARPSSTFWSSWWSVSTKALGQKPPTTVCRCSTVATG
jgi:hypothetical protein